MVHRLVLGGTPIVRGKRAMDEPPAEADSVRLRGVESEKSYVGQEAGQWWLGGW